MILAERKSSMTNLKKLREEKKITLRELAEKVNINYTALSRIETGNRNLNDEDIKILCKFFHVTSDYLLGLTDNKNEVITNKQKLSDVKLAFYNQAEEITDEQAEEVLGFINYIKERDKK